MRKGSQVIDDILRGYMTQNKIKRYTDAAGKLGLEINPKTERSEEFDRWMKGRPCTAERLQRILPFLGEKTIENARKRYAPMPGMQRHKNFAANSEDIFRIHIESTSRVRETRIGLPDYPPRDMKYRWNLNRIVYERLKEGSVHISKVEQINCYERAVDLAHNIETFPMATYEVRLYPALKRIPYLNFSIFDNQRAIAGGFHRYGPPHEPFMDFIGGEYIETFDSLWRYVWDEAEPLRQKKNAVTTLFEKYVSKIEGCENLALEKFKADVAQRGDEIEEYPTRY